MIFVLPFVHACVASVLLAALICWDAPLALKVLFAAAAGFCVLLIQSLEALRKHIVEIEMWARLTFIATETRRLDFRDKRRAMYILGSDLVTEKRDKEIGGALSAWARTRADIAFWLVYGLTLVVVTTLAVGIWPK